MPEDEKRLTPTFDPVYAIEGNTVVMHVIKASFGLDLTPQGRSKVSSWGSLEPCGILPVVVEMEEFGFAEREDGSRALTEQGAKDLFGKIIRMGVPGTKAGYIKMLERDDNDDF